MKAKPKSKTAKKVNGRAAAATKSIRLKAKPVKAVSSNGSRNGAKRPKQSGGRKVVNLETRRTGLAEAPPSARAAVPDRTRSKNFSSAITAYEAGIKAMHAEEFQKAVRCFQNLIADYSEEPEIQERAKVLLMVCEKKIHEKGGAGLRSSDDYYNIGIADLNRRQLDSAVDHLQHALKLTPKA